MIFLSVGTQLSFDRLVMAIDSWSEKNPDVEIFGQTGGGAYKPKNFNYTEWLNPEEYAFYFDKCGVLVSHAGMGSILTSLLKEKPIIIFPRLVSHGEHRNDHQIATARKFESMRGCYVAYDINSLFTMMDSYESLDAGCETKENLHLSDKIYKEIQAL